VVDPALFRPDPERLDARFMVASFHRSRAVVAGHVKVAADGLVNSWKL
jgi:hypothetical protein